MVDRATKLRWRRRFRRQRQQVEEVSEQAEALAERHFFKRLSRLTQVRRFIGSWLLLLTLLIAGSVVQLRALGQYYQELEPAPGGTYSEGIVGMFTNANPLYATSAVDSAVSHLVFSGLMKYDSDNQLVGDLAEDVSVGDRSLRYTVTLRPNLRWQDGRSLTAEDVVFTYKTIQNPDARSPLFSSWDGVQVEARGERTVVFTLPNQLGAFAHSLTNGIVPKHLLEDVPANRLRSAEFNTISPVGSGPFKWDALEVRGNTQEEREERIGLTPNEHFYRSRPKLNQFIIRTFRDNSLMIDAFEAGELDAMAGLEQVPDGLSDRPGIRDYNIPLTAEVMTFFNTNEPPLGDVNVRRALVQAVNTPEAVRSLGYPVIAAKGPLLMSQPGYDSKLTQLPFNKAEAQQRLDKVGWRKGADGIRKKGGQELALTLKVQNVNDYVHVSNYLRDAWEDIGVKMDVILQTEADIQSAVSRHDYQALLYGISVGPDPDVFAYWHSSQINQASARLNLSEYNSSKADSALEEGRIRSDPAVRAVKIRPFLEAWRSDAPALALYQPRFLYIVRGNLFNFNPAIFNEPTDRFSNVDNWMVREEKVVK